MEQMKSSRPISALRKFLQPSHGSLSGSRQGSPLQQLYQTKPPPPMGSSYRDKLAGAIPGAYREAFGI
ncbi:hypothetical protein CDL15_Pgr000226 [Punica granatum]|uniref:Uncharacterized protein n=1 Tax=Punica granatum TaxID=22663 RepID=A0A218Y416_PUNGR|nr:hypothetical protein CDL15_Pgr000226 [Punica granatum]